MSETVYCYHCGRRHQLAEMRRVHCGQIMRWRCLRSIEATKGTQAQRDAFGQATREANLRKNMALANTPLPSCVREVLRTLHQPAGHSL